MSIVKQEAKHAAAKAETRRAHERKGLGSAASIHELDEFGDVGTGFACEAADISRSGMGVRSRRMIHPGKSVFVRMKPASGGEKLFFGTVCYSRYDAKSLYHIGIRFVARPESAGVARWLKIEGLK